MGKVLFIACTNVGKSMIDVIMSDNSIESEICGIVNINAKRGISKANYHTYADVSEQYSLPLHYCNNINDSITLDWIRDKEPDIIIQTGWSQKFGDELLNLPKYGCIGEHPAPLPRGRGAACVNWAILTGETNWGDSFFRMVSEYDKGDLLAQDFFRIEKYDNVKTVYDKVALSSAKIVSKYIDDWTCGKLIGKPQTNEGSTYYKRRTPADGRFTFEMGASQLHDFIRAQTSPYPGAFIMLGEKKLHVYSSSVLEGVSSDMPHSSLFDVSNGYVSIVCGDKGIISIGRVQFENQPECWASDFIAEYCGGLKTGDLLK